MPNLALPIAFGVLLGALFVGLDSGMDWTYEPIGGLVGLGLIITLVFMLANRH